VDEFPRIKCGADRADAAVHHVGWGDDIDAGGGAGQRLLFENRNRFVVQHITGSINDAVLTVGGVRIQRDVGDYAEFGQMFFQRGDAAWHQPFGIGGFASVSGF